MKKTRRMLTVLLALMLMVSLLAVGVSAEEEDTSPYLSFCWLECDDSGWYKVEPEDWYHDNRDFGMTAAGEAWQVYYVNTWDGSQWVHTPVDPQKLAVSNLTVVPFSQMTGDDAQDSYGEDTQYFCKVAAIDWGDASVSYTMDDGTKLSVEADIQRGEAEFYSSPSLSNETYINGFLINPLAEENVFYFGFQSGYWTLAEAEVAQGADKVTLEKTDKSNVYKITVKEEVAENAWNEGGFDLSIRFKVTSEDNTEGEYWEHGMWVDVDWEAQSERKAELNIDGDDYFIFDNAVMKHYFTGEYNEWDDEIWKWEKTALPTGVSYDASSNTLTLNNASLTKLYVGYRWYDDWSGDEGFKLPSKDLTIKLVGSNEIVCDYDRAVVLMEEVSAAITGDGSLLVKAVNDNNVDGDGNHYAFNAFDLEGGASLTIGGNAKVTVELAGQGAYDIWEDDTVVGLENAFLSALNGGGGSLTLKDSATLTTVLPEGARDNGPEVTNDDDPYNNDYPGGYRGVEDFRSITVQDNATLNTTTLFTSDIWQWDEANEVNVLVEGGSFTQTGGTVNITALGSYGWTGLWQWNDETWEDELVGYTDHYQYTGLRTDGTITLSGGKLSITASPAEEEYDFSVGAELLGTSRGQINISGGTLELNTTVGDTISAGGWMEEETGTFNLTGGTVNSSGHISVRDYGTFNVTGGTLNAIGVNLNEILTVDGAYNQSGGTVNVDDRNTNQEVRTYGFGALGEVVLSDGELNVDAYYAVQIGGSKLRVLGGELNATGFMNGIMLWSTDMEVNGGSVNARSTGREMQAYDVNGELYTFKVGNALVLADDSASLTVNGGSHTFIGPDNDEQTAAGTSISSYGGTATFNGGSVYLNSDLTLLGDTASSTCPFTFSKDMKMVSCIDGHELTVFSEPYYVPIYDDNGEPMTDENGEIVYDTSTTYYSYWLEEDGVYGGGEEELCNFSPEVLIATTKCGDSASWSLDTKTGVLTVSGSGTMYDYAEGAAPWYHLRHLVKEVKLADTVTGIGSNAFYGCTALTKMSVGKNVTSVGTGAFKGCTALTVTLYHETAADKQATADGVKRDYIHEYKDATCTDPQTCKYCTATQGKALGHKWGTWKIVKGATTEAEGVEERACSVCGGKETRSIDKLPGGDKDDGDDKGETENPFVDVVDQKKYYYNPVLWAVSKGITQGTDATHFSPDKNCNRQQMVMFLWRYAGEPVVNVENPFTDVSESSRFYNAIMWAVSEGITTGKTATTFAPTDDCTRQQMVMFLYRMAGTPEIADVENPFTDVSESSRFYDAIMWAYSTGVTTGKTATTFVGTATCTRGQFVTFLYRMVVK